MNPAFSVIFFTTSSGTGYGLLTVLGLLNALGILPQHRVFLVLAVGLAIVLVTFGLLSSTLHLGHPERAWRAFTQWRSSWLSREGVLAVITYGPAMLFLWGCWKGEQMQTFYVYVGMATALLSLVTVYTTSMIYASLRSIAAWHHSLVPPIYLMLSVFSGLVLFQLLASLQGFSISSLAGYVCLLATGSWFLKILYWRSLDNAGAQSDAATATGLGPRGSVSQLLEPHSSDNYLLKEMGFRVAQKHATKLRQIARLLLFILPFTASAGVAMQWVSSFSLLESIAVLALIPGLLVERWLFFAEARHAVVSYYGR